LFSILLFYSTVCFHFAEQINDDENDEEKVSMYTPQKISTSPAICCYTTL